jgi:cytochrome P450
MLPSRRRAQPPSGDGELRGNLLESAQECPYALDLTATAIHAEAEELRARGPATRVQLPEGVWAWAVTDPHLTRWLTEHEHVSRDSRHWPAWQRGEISEKWIFSNFARASNALNSDGERHARLRRLLAPAFRPRRVRAMRPFIEEVTAGLLDRLAQLPAGEAVDLRAHFTWVLPLRVVNALLGVPPSQHDAFRRAFEGSFATDSPDAAHQARLDLHQHLVRLVETRRADRGIDVTSDLIAAHDEGDLSHEELLSQLLLLIGAGHETTVNLLGSGIISLLTHPEQLEQLRDGMVTWEHAVEEILRHQAPVAALPMRYAVQDLHHPGSGLTIRRGELILLHYAAAGRDPHIHSAPDRFDISRPAPEHLAFGHGVHYCLGAALARLEGAIGLRMLFERFPQLELALPAERLPPLPSIVSNGPREVPVLLYGNAPD